MEKSPKHSTGAGSKGFSLIEALIAVGVMSIVSLGIASMIANMTREKKALSDQLEVLSLQFNLTRMMAEPETCSCSLKNAKLKGEGDGRYVEMSNTISFAYGPAPACNQQGGALVKEGVPLASYSDVTPKKISIENVRSLGGASSNRYAGELTVEFSPKSASVNIVRLSRPITIPVTFTTNASDTVVGCSSNSPDYYAASVKVDRMLGGLETKVVSLPSGMFRTPPRVFIQPNFGRYSGDEGMTWWVSNVTVSSFTLNWQSTNQDNNVYGESEVDYVAFSTSN